MFCTFVSTNKIIVNRHNSKNKQLINETDIMECKWPTRYCR